MRILLRFIILILLFSGTVFSSEELLLYKISPKCIESISVNESSFAGHWHIDIELSASESLDLNRVTQENLGHKFALVDAGGNDIGFPAATLQAALSKHVRLAGFDSVDKAEYTKKQISTNTGECGFTPNKLTN